MPELTKDQFVREHIFIEVTLDLPMHRNTKPDEPKWTWVVPRSGNETIILDIGTPFCNECGEDLEIEEEELSDANIARIIEEHLVNVHGYKREKSLKAPSFHEKVEQNDKSSSPSQ